MANKVHKAKKFLKKDIWSVQMDELSKAKARFVRYIKVAIITMKTFSSERIGFQAVALSFFSTMAVVPFVAIMFALTDGLGLSDGLRDLIYSMFNNSQESIDALFGFSENLLSNAQHGGMNLISSIILCCIVVVLMLNVEKVFNNVWRVRDRRKLIKRLAYVIIMIILSPFIVMLFFSGAILYSDILTYLGIDYDNWNILRTLLSWTLFGTIAAFVFAAMYKFIPNADVSFGPAIRAAIPSAVAFSTLQYLYLETQLLFTNLNSIYGAFAAVPLFMIWINIGWFIILIGAELSYAFQHVDSYNIDD